jgi:aminoglycoside phosphotransferase (APT) family kinase protein
LFEALDGAPALSGALAGKGPLPGSLVDAAAAVAAGLHRSGLSLSETRPMEADIAELRDLVDMMGKIAPDVAAGVDRMLTEIDASAAATSALGLGPTHGDFTPSQLLTDGEACGLVDFDSMALAEPARDLGQYLAYLRLASAKAGLPVDATEELGQGFRDAYARASGTASVDGLAARTRRCTPGRSSSRSVRPWCSGCSRRRWRAFRRQRE